MDSVNNTSSSKAISKDNNDQSSRRRRKRNFIICFVIIFSIIIGSIIAIFVVLKHETESEAHALYSDPNRAIRAVCSLTPSPGLCSSGISNLQRINPSKTTSPSKIFTLSLQATFNELAKQIKTIQRLANLILMAKNPRALAAAKNCKNLLTESMRLVNKSMAIMGSYPNEEIFREEENIRNLKGWMNNVTGNINRCINEMRNSTTDDDGLRFNRFRRYDEISFMILMKMDLIHDMFEPSIQSVLTNPLLNDLQFDLNVSLFCFEYVFLIILLIFVLRLY